MKKTLPLYKAELPAVRSRSGFSLITVLLIGVCAVLWLAAMSAAVIPAYQRSTQTKINGELRNAAESAIDFTIDQILANVPQGKPCSYDDNSPGSPYTTFTAPQSLYSNSSITVSVTVKNTSPPTFSSAYRAAFSSNQLVQYWRVIEATASNGVFSRTMRVVLRPNPPTYGTANPYSFPFATMNANNNFLNPVSKYSAFGLTNLVLGSGSTTDGYNSAQGYPLSHMTASDGVSKLGGDVGSYNFASLNNTTGSVTVGGNVDVPSSNGSAAVSASGSSSNNTQINRYLTTNGAVTGFSDGSGGGSYTNVMGMSSSSLPPDTSRSGALETAQNATQVAVPPAPPPPSTFQDGVAGTSTQSLGSINTNSTTILVTNSAPAPPYTIPSSGTVSIQPGNYTVNSMNISGTGQIIVGSDVSSAQPVRFYVNENSNASSAVDITSNSGIRNFSNNPSNLQIYYNGTGDVTLAQGRSFSGVLYAPSATVGIGNSGGATTNYYGAFVGNTLATINANLHYDRSMMPGGSNGFGNQLNNAYKPSGSSGSGSSQNNALGSFTIVSYQEL